ncbi:hypothetical protein [Kitasatospora cineracea]|nr:hypothetical protein [Kitasatospora cineracea]
MSMLLTASCAVPAGMRPYTTIGQWTAAPQRTLARPGTRCVAA